MNNSKSIALANTKDHIFLKVLLLLYPLPYRKHFENEMVLVFNDMYEEELQEYGKIRFIFWFSQAIDLLKSVFEQHEDFLRKYGVKKYTRNILHLNKYNILGVFFLLPFVSVFFIDVISRIVQGNLSHPNELVLHGLYNTPLYWFPILFTWVIIFPLLAFAVNVIPLVIKLLMKGRKFTNVLFIKENIVTIAISLTGIFVISLVTLHDFLPCLINSLLVHGGSNLGNIILVCRNA